MSVDEIEAGLPVALASGKTNSSGAYSITFTPASSGSYQVSTGQIAQIENASLNPVFGDLLSPAATSVFSVNVQSAVTIASASSSPGRVTVSGTVAPGAADANAIVQLLARPVGSTGDYRNIGVESLATGSISYSIAGALAPGRWQLEVSYSDPGQLLGATSTPATATVSSAVPSIGFKKVKVKGGVVTVSGSLGPAESAAAEKSARARAWAATPSARRRAGSAIRASMAPATAPASPAGTKRPDTPDSTTSGTPPTAVATLGHPKHMASRMLRQKLSRSEVKTPRSA